MSLMLWVDLLPPTTWFGSVEIVIEFFTLNLVVMIPWKEKFNESECIRNHHLFSQHLSTISTHFVPKKNLPLKVWVANSALSVYWTMPTWSLSGPIPKRFTWSHRFSGCFLITLTWLKYQSFVFAWKCFANKMDDKVTDTIIVYRVCQYINVRWCHEKNMN